MLNIVRSLRLNSRHRTVSVKGHASVSILYDFNIGTLFYSIFVRYAIINHLFFCFRLLQNLNDLCEKHKNDQSGFY